MIVQQTGTERANSKTIERWTGYLEDLHVRIAHRFQRPEVRARAYRYLTGLLGGVRRKNSWQMASAIGEPRPRGVQHLLNDARWDADLVRDDLREYVAEHLGDEESGVLIVDETGFLKKGEKSVGVARQYTGTAGKRENCQVGVFLCYASKRGAAFVDRALYLPHEWAEDPARREEAGVPEEVRFATKGELAKEMLRRALEAGVPARWVVADTVYGTARGLRGWLEERGRWYVLAVPGTQDSTTRDASDRRGRWRSSCRRRRDFGPSPVIPNPVVDYTYAKETRVVSPCEYRTAGAPLQEGQGSRGTLSSSDRVASQPGQDHRGGVRGHRLQPRLGTPHSPPLQRAGRRGPRRPPPHANPGARERALLDEEGQAQLREEALLGPVPGGGMWSGPKVARWIAQRNGLEKVHVQRGFEYLRKVGMSPQVPRPSNAQGADDSEREAFKKVCR